MRNWRKSMANGNVYHCVAYFVYNNQHIFICVFFLCGNKYAFIIYYLCSLPCNYSELQGSKTSNVHTSVPHYLCISGTFVIQTVTCDALRPANHNLHVLVDQNQQLYQYIFLPVIQQKKHNLQEGEQH
jgi:hypothetical protein